MMADDQNDPVERVEHIQDHTVEVVNADCRFPAEKTFVLDHRHGLSGGVSGYMLIFSAVFF